MHCKYCHSEKPVRFGHSKNRQRWLCHACGHTFLGTADTLPGMRFPPEVISFAIQTYYAGLSLKSIQHLESQQFGFYPANSSMCRWINYFTQHLISKTQDCIPRVGDVWVANQSASEIGGSAAWIHDLIDVKTGYFLASRVSQKQELKNLVDLHISNIDKVKGLPLTILADENSFPLLTGSNLSNRYKVALIDHAPSDTHNVFRNIKREIATRTESAHQFKNIHAACLFAAGWAINHNHFQPYELLHAHSPAKAAGVNLSYGSWLDVVKDPSLNPHLRGAAILICLLLYFFFALYCQDAAVDGAPPFSLLSLFFSPLA